MNVLFVSEKDECRGPMARVLSQMHARDMGVPAAGFDSAGVDVTRSASPPDAVVDFLRDQGLNIAKHRSRPIAAAQVRWADLVLCMTRAIADRVRTMLGPERQGIVVVLNDAVRFGRSSAEKDIQPVKTFTHHELLVTFSRIKAATGRLVRLMSQGEENPTDFGAAPVREVQRARFLDDPEIRRFLSRYILEFIERAFEFPRSDELIEALAVMGRPLSVLDLEELIRDDLKGQVFQEVDGRWHIDPHVREERARQRRERVEQQRRREEEEEARDRARRERESREGRRHEEHRAGRGRHRESARASTGGNGSGDEDAGPLTDSQAFEILSITLRTPRDEASRKYKQLLMRFHPDKFHDDDEFRVMAEKKTKRINQAWAMVKDRLPSGDDD